MKFWRYTGTFSSELTGRILRGDDAPNRRSDLRLYGTAAELRYHGNALSLAHNAPGFVIPPRYRGVFPEHVEEATEQEYLAQDHVGEEELALTPQLNRGPAGLI